MFYAQNSRCNYLSLLRDLALWKLGQNLPQEYLPIRQTRRTMDHSTQPRFPKDSGPGRAGIPRQIRASFNFKLVCHFFLKKLDCFTKTVDFLLIAKFIHT
jgi:hypothetical protein